MGLEQPRAYRDAKEKERKQNEEERTKTDPSISRIADGDCPS